MKSTVNWESGIKFEAKIDEFSVKMDGRRPVGEGSAPTPKHLLLTAIAGCTGMDVVSLLKKYKQFPAVTRYTQLLRLLTASYSR